MFCFSDVNKNLNFVSKQASLNCKQNQIMMLPPLCFTEEMEQWSCGSGRVTFNAFALLWLDNCVHHRQCQNKCETENPSANFWLVESNLYSLLSLFDTCLYISDATRQHRFPPFRLTSNQITAPLQETSRSFTRAAHRRLCRMKHGGRDPHVCSYTVQLLWKIHYTWRQTFKPRSIRVTELRFPKMTTMSG